MRLPERPAVFEVVTVDDAPRQLAKLGFSPSWAHLLFVAVDPQQGPSDFGPRSIFEGNALVKTGFRHDAIFTPLGPLSS